MIHRLLKAKLVPHRRLVLAFVVGLPLSLDPKRCWEWTKARYPTGYGRVVGGLYAHRVAYELCIGPIPKGLHVLHRCDNPPCVNPEHLWVGTVADNMHDRDAKGRGRGGPNQPNRRLVTE